MSDMLNLYLMVRSGCLSLGESKRLCVFGTEPFMSAIGFISMLSKLTMNHTVYFMINNTIKLNIIASFFEVFYIHTLLLIITRANYL